MPLNLRHPTEWTLHAHALGLLDWAVAESVDHPDYEITASWLLASLLCAYPPWIKSFVLTNVMDFSWLSISPTKTIDTALPGFRRGRQDAGPPDSLIRENSTMNSDDTTRTSPTLLRRTADWRDHDAWREFVARYEPYDSKLVSRIPPR